MTARYGSIWSTRGADGLLANVRQECHKPGSFDSLGHCMLAGGGATCLAAAYDFTMTIDKFFQ